MIREKDLDATTFTAWRAPGDALPVLYSIVEAIFMLAFGTFREKDTALTALRSRFMEVKSFGIFDVDQPYRPANDSLSINEVTTSVNSFDNYLLRKRT
jgi:hypothetical protein